jgi:cyanate permease
MGSFVGVWLSGIVFDQTGSYQIILIIAIVSSIVAGIASMAIKERPISELIRGAQNRF